MTVTMPRFAQLFMEEAYGHRDSNEWMPIFLRAWQEKFPTHYKASEKKWHSDPSQMIIQFTKANGRKSVEDKIKIILSHAMTKIK